MSRRDDRRYNERLTECLGQVIAERRRKLGLTQQDFADLTGLDRAFISKVELGKRNPSFLFISEIARGLNIKYSRLIQKCEEQLKDE